MNHLAKKVYPQQKKTFSGRNIFPGEIGNPFDNILRRINKINQISPWIFALLLFALAGILTFFELTNWTLLISFCIGDWILIHNLKNFQISYGQSQSQVFLLFILRIPFIWLTSPINIIMQLIGILLVLYGFYYEPSIIQCSNYEIDNNKFKKNKVNIIQIGDIHLERMGLRERKLIKILTQKQPDLIVFTGDFLNLSYNSDPKSINQIIDLFNNIQNIAPTYCTTGSPAVDLTSTIKIIEDRTNVHFLNDQQCIIDVNGEILNIIGLSCSHNPQRDIHKLNQLNTNPELFNLLLHHSPDLLFEITDKNNIDLMLSGHTHGGQVRLPFFGAIFTGSLYGRIFQRGLYQFMSTYLYISRGVGFEGMGAPRVRFLCKPEIINWQI
jgi:predicted MPP superfamily phosphohydrolase